MGAPRGAIWRVAALSVAAIVTACQASGPVASITPPSSTGPAAAASAPGESALPSAPAGAAGPAATTLAALPADIVTAVNAIVDAATPQAAIDATRTVLERSGVVVADVDSARTGSTASMYVTSDEVAVMAYEAQRRSTTSRATFGEFATMLAGVAGLPGAKSPAVSAAGDEVQVNVREQPARLASFVSAWVALAVQYHRSADRDEAALTNAPLYLAALAARQAVPVELREAFLPSELRLGSLDMTLFVAGLRATLAAARRDVPAPSAAPSATPTAKPSGTATPTPSPHARGGPVAGSGVAYRPGSAEAPAIVGDECSKMFEHLTGAAPVAGDMYTFALGEHLKSFVSGVVSKLASEAEVVEQRLGVLFEVLGILARVQALYLLYTTVEVKTEVSPDALHKAIDQKTDVTAKVTAAIPDKKWDEFRAEQKNSPLMSLLQNCMRAYGLPVTNNIGDIAEAMKSWRASWYVTKGLEHVYFVGDQFLGPGAVASRLERPLKRDGDHKATDSITVQVQPEKASDHPGKERQAAVEVCSGVRTNEPPNLKLLLSAGVSGSGAGDMPIRAGADRVAQASGKLFGPAAIASLAATIADILAGWIQFVKTLKSCAPLRVDYHRPQPGRWTGTVTIKSEFSESYSGATSGTTTYGKVQIHHSKQAEGHTTTRSGEELTVSGDDDLVLGYTTVLLKGTQLTYGFNENESLEIIDGVKGDGCLHTSAKASNYSGTFSYRSDEGQVILVIRPDGSYVISIRLDSAPLDGLVIKGTDSSVYAPTGDALIGGLGGFKLIKRNCGGSDSTRPSTLPARVATRVGEGPQGKLDPQNPGSRIAGSMTVTGSDGSVSVIRWDLQHDGPIRLPAPR